MLEAGQSFLDEMAEQWIHESAPDHEPKGAQSTERTEPQLDWVESFLLTDEEKQMLSDPKWIYPNLIIQGHVIAIPAKPNGGKTTLMTHISGEIASEYRVFYVNCDVSGSDAKPMLEHADRHGYKMLLPDMKVGLSMDDVVAQLERMNAANADYTGLVFVIDTLKKRRAT